MTQQKIMAFIDGYSTQAAARTIGFDIDYKKLFDFIEGDDMLVRANYYACVPDLPPEQNNSLVRVLDWLSYNRFNVIRKKTRAAAEGVKPKNCVTVEMTTDILEAARHVDCIALFSGDGDFKYLIDRVQRVSGAYVVVFGDMDSTADDLRRQADNFVDLKTIAHEIAKDKPKPEQEAA